jgi:CheY-like chemotaxis protein
MLHRNSNIKVLLLEDDADDAFVIQKLLTPITWNASRFTVKTVESLADCLSSVAAERPDVILSDLFLPDSKGSETVKNIWRQAPYLPIVVLTGHDDDDFAMEALQVGAQDYLVKGSFDGKMLARVVHYAIERANNQAELTRLALFLEQNPVPIIEVDLGAEAITYTNPAARMAFADLVTLGMLHPLLQGLRFVINRMQNEGNQLHIRDLQLRDCVYEQQITFSPQKNLARLYVNDISQRRHLELLKEHFLNVISHELRSPMASIKGAIDTLSSPATGPLNDKQS